MVEIISKRDGPRREDAEIKQLVERNRGVITRIADHISGGAYSVNRMARPEIPKARGLIIHHTGAGSPSSEEACPYIRVSLNGRVVVVDRNTARQIQYLGEIRRRNGADVFVLATKENGFVSPLDATSAVALAEFDGRPLRPDYTEEQLAGELGSTLGIAE
ncbi:hypothetical protein QN219_22965 [Sinorhizobium sp. 7-81]|uniref:hypothetical protein n=1 Tax=unclassified Sinorhizobium TaxID=2613772 RepID=UPI0024C2D112|nr:MULTISPECIES: hypothetical protein [unclassified Sinorhizobium]MDK1389443.1 hypothetical protein [Sinorhizobium sp. 7-81]MDK1492887.1 hypothetical protein [Sinorhizobium sp. 8-89]